jgi:3-deoxy-D-manno-octulosonic-acid transferase
MLQSSYQVILGMGGFFVLLGIIFILWNKKEKKKYYNSILLTRRDIKETITHEHERFWLHAWQIGGRISLILGIVLLIIGGILWFIAP